MNLLALFALFVHSAVANTEKTTFVAPAYIVLPTSAPALEHLRLETLSSTNSTLRTALSVAFPTQDNPQGLESWYLLRNLNKGQRYEVRTCWAAIQPTDFWLDVYNITHVFDTPHLIQSLASFADERPSSSELDTFQSSHSPPDNISDSVLFLHVRAAASFFTTNKTLMQHPPLVKVDIILDPYLANALPTSLLPTAAYIVILAIGAWFASGRIGHFLHLNHPQKERKD